MKIYTVPKTTTKEVCNPSDHSNTNCNSPLTTKNLTRKTLIMNPHRNTLPTTTLSTITPVAKRRLIRTIDNTRFTTQPCPRPQRMGHSIDSIQFLNAIGTDAKVSNVGGEVGFGHVGGGEKGVGEPSLG